MLCITLLRSGHPVELGDSIASEGKGEYMYVEGQVLSTDGKPIPDAVIETWETDELGTHQDHVDTGLRILISFRIL